MSFLIKGGNFYPKYHKMCPERYNKGSNGTNFKSTTNSNCSCQIQFQLQFGYKIFIWEVLLKREYEPQEIF
jgi:hypothetical protein